MRFLLLDSESHVSQALTRFRSIFSLKDGIWSPVERYRLLYPCAEFYYSHPDKAFEQAICESEGYFRCEDTSPDADYVLEGDVIRKSCLKFESIRKVGGDLSLINRSTGHWLTSTPQSLTIIGSPHDVLMHENVSILPGVIVDARNGPVVFSEGCSVGPFSYIEGPVFFGKRCQIADARITGGGLFDEGCRISGEIETSVFGRYTNKHHQGFVGHSLVGSWVNFGALTTTSDLKNNYGTVRLKYAPNLLRGESTVSISTGQIKFGAIIGDFVKLAIGTMIPTGAVFEFGANIFGGTPEKYVPPLAWGQGGQRYNPERFFEDSKKICARRSEPLPNRFREFLVLNGVHFE